jgi:hypothetical protein
MALIRNFVRVSPKTSMIHDEVHKCDCSDFVTEGGKKIFQFRTYGKPGRDHPEKVSQAIQLDEKSASELVRLLREVFPALRS